jgi:hypothetical protein
MGGDRMRDRSIWKQLLDHATMCAKNRVLKAKCKHSKKIKTKDDRFKKYGVWHCPTCNQWLDKDGMVFSYAQSKKTAGGAIE